ncbi:hypothetical protein [Flavobacterium nitrogenifigens]|uniref:hypothetical protein n=1 Tax=Flavobacterium nitrogenifigens TaxID=1617283 RepID=UPI0031AE4D66
MYFQGEKIKNLLPYLGSLLIICGYLKLSIFYSHFGIKISDYLEITEVLTLFLSDAFKYTALILGIFIFYFVTDSSEEVEKKEQKKNDIIETEKWFPRLIKFLKFSANLLINMLIYLIFTIACYIWKPENIYFFVLVDVMLLFVLIFLYCLLEYRRKYKITFGRSLNSTYNNLILTVFVFLLFVFQSAYIEIKTVVKESPYFVCFEYLKKDYQSEINYFYLGQTKNYLFMYDNLNKEAIVFNRKDVNNFVVRKR